MKLLASYPGVSFKKGGFHFVLRVDLKGHKCKGTVKSNLSNEWLVRRIDWKEHTLSLSVYAGMHQTKHTFKQFAVSKWAPSDQLSKGFNTNDCVKVHFLTVNLDFTPHSGWFRAQIGGISISVSDASAQCKSTCCERAITVIRFCEPRASLHCAETWSAPVALSVWRHHTHHITKPQHKVTLSCWGYNGRLMVLPCWTGRRPCGSAGMLTVSLLSIIVPHASLGCQVGLMLFLLAIWVSFVRQQRQQSMCREKNVCKAWSHRHSCNRICIIWLWL